MARDEIVGEIRRVITRTIVLKPYRLHQGPHLI